jgi:uncharacterized coiled-coil protein SlyX
MDSVQSYLARKPNARGSKIAELHRRDATTAQLISEVNDMIRQQRQKAAASKPSLFRRLVELVRKER